MRRISVMGGSYDPVHCGHLMVASAVVASGACQEVWMVLSPRNPLKDDAPQATDAQRLEMLRLATEGDHTVRPSAVELSLEPPYYTLRTLRTLAAKHPDCRFSLVIGADNWLSFSRWREPEAIIREHGVLVYPRPGYPLPAQLPPGVRAVEAPQVELSATYIRQQLARGRSMRYFVPRAVMRYISDNSLYHYHHAQ